MLTLTDTSGTNLTGVKFSAGVQESNANVLRATTSGNSSLKDGDTINLITNANGLTTDSTLSTGILSEGVSQDYKLTLAQSGNSLVATVGESGGNTNSGGTGDNGGSSSGGSTNSGGNSSGGNSGGGGTPLLKQTQLIGETNRYLGEIVHYPDELTLGDEVQLAMNSEEQKNNWEIFASMGAQHLHSKGSLGAYMDSNSYATNIGAARKFNYSEGNSLLFAPVFDYGGGSYDSYLNDTKRGEGAAHHWAGGAIFRRSFDTGFYVGGSFRYGRILSDFDSNDLTSSLEKAHVSYDAGSNYFAGHIDLGRIIKIDPENTLDIYGVYFRNRVGSMSAGLSTGENYHFGAANNHRFRVGARLTRQVNELTKFYSGIGYMYEHLGASIATYKGKQTPGGSVSGSSGMLELGWQMRMGKDSPVALNVSATGWVGRQRGASIQAKFEQAF